jgi:hypothetical protein
MVNKYYNPIRWCLFQRNLDMYKYLNKTRIDCPMNLTIRFNDHIDMNKSLTT